MVSISKTTGLLKSGLIIKPDNESVGAGTRQVPFAPSCEILIQAFICTEPKILRLLHFLTFHGFFTERTNRANYK